MDQLSHSDLISRVTVDAADQMAEYVLDVTVGKPPLAVLMVLAACFGAMCALIDVDPTAAFEQIADLYDAGAVPVPVIH